MDPIAARLTEALGPAAVLQGEDARPYETDWRGLFHGRSACVVRPGSTAEVATAVRLCAGASVPIVPQGGNTGLAGGASVGADGRAVLLNLSRLDRIRDVDPLDLTLVVEAGVPLARAQDAAESVGRLLPLSISSEGSAQIGGVLATNAGGNLTIRYGNARDLVLGLEVVLADGQVFDGLRRLRKDNTGYCLRQLFCGSEGTLGIITAAVLKLVPRPRQSVTLLASAGDAHAVLDLFGLLSDRMARAITAFEYMSDMAVELALRHVEGLAMPLGERAPAYALVELEAEQAAVEAVLADAFEHGMVQDAVLAASGAQARALWRLREELSDAQARAGASVKNDVSVPVSRMARFIDAATEAVEGLVPGGRIAPFGHVGDGNVHFNVVQPAGADRTAFLDGAEAIVDRVAAIVQAHDGSFSAEHGVGVMKRHLMSDWRGGAELDLMRRIKHALDPADLMNPGKVLPAS